MVWLSKNRKTKKSVRGMEFTMGRASRGINKKSNNRGWLSQSRCKQRHHQAQRRRTQRVALNCSATPLPFRYLRQRNRIARRLFRTPGQPVRLCIEISQNPLPPESAPNLTQPIWLPFNGHLPQPSLSPRHSTQDSTPPIKPYEPCPEAAH